MKKEIPWELIISDLKQDISDADKKHLEEWVSIDENRKVYEELRGVWEKVRAKVINYTPDISVFRIIIRIISKRSSRMNPYIRPVRQSYFRFTSPIGIGLLRYFRLTDLYTYI